MRETELENGACGSLGSNLQYLRQQKNMSQEALAEELGVSRQSVSKWESGVSYPEMGTILTLCDLFHMDMDTLLRGSAEKSLATDGAGYDAFMNRFARAIAGGVALILFGVGLLVGLVSYAEYLGMSEFVQTIPVAILLLCILVAVVFFVAFGIQMDQFRQKNPVLEDFYTPKQREEFSHRFVWWIAVPIAAILGDVILLLLLGALVEDTPYEGFVVMSFLWIIGGAVAGLIWGGIQNDKYDIAKYNLQNTPEYKKMDERKGAICGVVMLLATAFYLYMGFAHNGWGIYFWAFPIGGLLCGIVSTVVESRYKQHK